MKGMTDKAPPEDTKDADYDSGCPWCGGSGGGEGEFACIICGGTGKIRPLDTAAET
jgi:hypothetical protein